MIKLIGVDFDSTIADWNDGGRIGGELLGDMADFIGAGGLAGIVSGRPYGSCEEHFRLIGQKWAAPFPSFIVVREAYIVFTGEVPEKLSADTALRNADMKRLLTAFTSKVAERAAGWTREVIDGGARIKSFAIFGDYALEYSVTDPENGDKAARLLRNILSRDGFDDAVVNRNGNLVAIAHRASGKGNALIALGGLLGIRPEEILAIGDSLNDLSMTDGRLGILGGCVGNADDELKRAVAGGGGIIGEGRAWRGVSDVMKKALAV